MAKFLAHKQALELRKQGKSYNQIKQIIPVSKSTLSYWLHGMPLSDDMMRSLRDLNEVRIEKFRETWRKKRQQRLQDLYQVAREKWSSLSFQTLHVAGLFLYWGEGTKNTSHPLVITNSNPAVIKFALFWMHKILKMPLASITFRLKLYSDMDVKKEHRFWAQELDIPLRQFRKCQIKNSNSETITYATSKFWHGTCEIHGGSVILKEQVMMEIKAIADIYKMGV